MLMEVPDLEVPDLEVPDIPMYTFHLHFYTFYLNQGD